MSTMVEKIARAICALNYQDPSEMTNSYPDGPLYPVWKDFEGYARAAIEAMREPTSKMLDAVADEEERRGYFSYENLIAEEVWPLMIQTALKEEAQ